MYIHRIITTLIVYFAKKIFRKCFYIFFPRIRTLTKLSQKLFYIIDTQQKFGTKNIDKSLHKSKRYVHVYMYIALN